MLNEEDQAHYADLLAPYVQGTAGQYCYRIKNDDLRDHLQQIGQVMCQLVDELGDRYGDQESYRLLRRVFSEHFAVCANRPTVDPTPLATPGRETTASDAASSATATHPETDDGLEKVTPTEALSITPKPSESLRADSLQSPDDTAATYRARPQSFGRG